MKSYQLLAFLLIGVLFSVSLQAQDDREDVVYLKNGNIYRGTIIEQVPGVSIKVETIGGNVFTVQIGDIIKTTKEKKAESYTPSPHDRYMHGESYYHSEKHEKKDSSSRREFHYKRRGYFNTGQLLIENLVGGGRLVNGYKFGQCGYLGIGIGVNLVFNDLRGNNQNYSGVYLPLYLYYGGDILKKRITPFYSVEAGYSARMNPNSNNNFPGPNIINNNSGASSVAGGLMGGLGFGVKFYSRHRVFFSLSAHADVQQARNTYPYYYLNYNYYPNYKVSTTLLVPGIRLGIGF